MNATDLCNFFINWIPAPRLRKWIYRRCGMRLDPTAHIMRNCVFMDLHQIEIGARAIIGHNCHLDGRGGLRIGADTNVSGYARIFTAEHFIDDKHFAGHASPVVLEDHVWVAAGATILPGVTMKKGSVAAAGSVVTRDVEAFDVVAGVPARVIRKRNPHIDYQLSSKPSRYL